MEFLDAAPYVGLDNIDMRERIAARFRRHVGRAISRWSNITRAGENLVLTSAIMGGPEGVLRARRSRREDGIAEG